VRCGAKLNAVQLQESRPSPSDPLMLADQQSLFPKLAISTQGWCILIIPHGQSAVTGRPTQIFQSELMARISSAQLTAILLRYLAHTYYTT
jgi:Leucine-rich repeat (LRR) protein